MKKITKCLLSLFCCITVAAAPGCSSVPADDKTATDPITIWVWDETFNVKAAKIAAKIYQKSHPDVPIQVEIREREEILADVKNLLSSKLYQNLPDIIMIEDYDIQEMLMLYQEEFVDLTDRMDTEQFVEYKRRLYSKNGRVYGIPFDSGAAALFYRVDLIEQAGYTEEDMQNLTWERFLEIGQDVYETTGISMLTLDPTDFPFIRILMQSCGSWYCADDGTTVTIADNPAIYSGLNILKRLLETNVGKSANGWNEFISAFQNGEAACVLSGAWIISSIKEAPEQSGLWRVAPIPLLSDVSNATRRSNIGGSSWYILKNSPSCEQATDFMVSMFGNNRDVWSKLVDEIGVIPCLKDAESLEHFEAEDSFFGGQKVTKLLTGFSAEVPAVNYGIHTYEIESILQQEFQNVLTGGNLDKCLESAQRKAQAISEIRPHI